VYRECPIPECAEADIILLRQQVELIYVEIYCEGEGTTPSKLGAVRKETEAASAA